MKPIDGIVRHYDWGSVDAIAHLLGQPATGEPFAELWFGAHPSAPAVVDGVGLDEMIAADPVAALGAEVASGFTELPFLFKVLSAASPLSLQVHPSTAQAEAGYADEEARNIPLDAPNRIFRDPRHKPELVCALSEFSALCGFRRPEATIAVLATIPERSLDPIRGQLRNASTCEVLRALLQQLFTLNGSAAADLVNSVVEACRSEGPDHGKADRRMVVTLGERYPGDIGVIVALLLNKVTLQPGEALFLGAGQLHCYLEGTAVEIMANSDNVIRGGLTSKHVDVATLLEVVNTTVIDPVIQCPAAVNGVTTYSAPVSEFSLARVDVDGSTHLPGGPAIVLCTSGSMRCVDRALRQGQALWVPATDRCIGLTGSGTVFRSGVGKRAEVLRG